MNRETRWAVAIVAGVLLLIGVVLWWFSTADTPLVESPAPNNAGESVTEALPGASPATPPEPLTPTIETSAGGKETAQEASAPSADDESMETIRIIVREPVTVDGVDVEQALKGKVIINEDQVVDRPVSQ